MVQDGGLLTLCVSGPGVNILPNECPLGTGKISSLGKTFGQNSTFYPLFEEISIEKLLKLMIHWEELLKVDGKNYQIYGRIFTPVAVIVIWPLIPPWFSSVIILFFAMCMTKLIFIHSLYLFSMVLRLCIEPTFILLGYWQNSADLEYLREFATSYAIIDRVCHVWYYCVRY